MTWGNDEPFHKGSPAHFKFSGKVGQANPSARGNGNPKPDKKLMFILYFRLFSVFSGGLMTLLNDKITPQ